jgi:hypothetical protein
MRGDAISVLALDQPSKAIGGESYKATNTVCDKQLHQHEWKLENLVVPTRLLTNQRSEFTITVYAVLYCIKYFIDINAGQC